MRWSKSYLCHSRKQNAHQLTAFTRSLRHREMTRTRRVSRRASLRPRQTKTPHASAVRRGIRSVRLDHGRTGTIRRRSLRRSLRADERLEESGEASSEVLSNPQTSLRDVRKELFSRDDGNGLPGNETAERNPGSSLLSPIPRESSQNLARRRSRRLSLRTVGLRRPELVPGASNNLIEGAFSGVFEEAVLKTVELDQCVSLEELRVRPLLEFGVKKVMELLKGSSIGLVTGYVHVGKFPVVAALPEIFKSQIISYFVGKRRSRELTERWINSHTIYHIVNGGYEHEARWRLAAQDGWQFGGLTWRTLVIPWQPPDTLRSISMISNQLQKKEFSVEVSFMEELLLIRRVIDQFIASGELIHVPGKNLPRGFPQKVAKLFSGDNAFANCTLRVLIGVAAKATTASFQVMKEVLDREVPEIAKQVAARKNVSDSSSVEFVDERAFRKLVNSKTLRGVTKFFRLVFSDEDRKNALRRLCNRAQASNKYKGVSSADLDDQVCRTRDARLEIEKFEERILCNNNWPAKMKTTCQNLLETEKLDGEVEDNKKSPSALLKSLRNQYVHLTGPPGATKVEQYERMLFSEDSNDGKNGDTGLLTPGMDGQEANEGIAKTDDHSNSIKPSRVRDSEPLPERELSDELNIGSGGAEDHEASTEEGIGISSKPGGFNGTPQRTPVSSGASEPEAEPSVLQKFKIEVNDMGWEQYNRTVLAEQAVFDFLFADPFQSTAKETPRYMHGESMAAFIDFARKVLVPGGYLFVIVPPHEAPQWMSSMREKELPNPHLFYLLWDPTEIQKTKGRSLQNPLGVAIFARKPGTHPKRFVIDVERPYSFLRNCTYSRKFAVIDRIPAPASRLRFPGTKVQVRREEKHHALHRELMSTFCPPGGKVLDPFANTMTTGIACVLSGRQCVLLEQDQACYSIALKRLESFAVDELKSRALGPVIEAHSEGNAETRDGEDSTGPALDLPPFPSRCENANLTGAETCSGKLENGNADSSVCDREREPPDDESERMNMDAQADEDGVKSEMGEGHKSSNSAPEIVAHRPAFDSVANSRLKKGGPEDDADAAFIHPDNGDNEDNGRDKSFPDTLTKEKAVEKLGETGLSRGKGAFHVAMKKGKTGIKENSQLSEAAELKATSEAQDHVPVSKRVSSGSVPLPALSGKQNNKKSIAGHVKKSSEASMEPLLESVGTLHHVLKTPLPAQSSVRACIRIRDGPVKDSVTQGDLGVSGELESDGNKYPCKKSGRKTRSKRAPETEGKEMSAQRPKRARSRPQRFG